jgi:aryl-phospho-beta-D-glucosidase BglC (GH1 family)
LQAKDASQLTADFIASSPDAIGWDNNPATFEIAFNSSYHGEYQLANWLGPEQAPNVFKQHWQSFITESDFEYLNGIGINTVRIPVGYWIASDPNPPKPFVAGSLQVLDNAFDWAE